MVMAIRKHYELFSKQTGQTGLRFNHPDPERSMKTALCSFLLLFATVSICSGRTDEWLVDEIRFYGNESFRPTTLLRHMQLQPSRLFLPQKFSYEKLAEDIVRLEAFYRQRGYLSAVAGIMEIHRDSSRQLVTIDISISEGSLASIDTLIFEENHVFSDSFYRNLVKVHPGNPLDSTQLALEMMRIQNRLNSLGYLFAESRFQIDRSTRAVIIDVREGHLVQAGDLEIPQDITVSEEVIKRELWFDKGDTLTPRLLGRSREALQETELFTFVAIDPIDTAYSDTGTLIAPVVIRLQQGDLVGLQIIGGYDAYEEFFGQARILFRNLFNRGHRLALTTRVSSVYQRGEATYVYPGILSDRLDADGSVYLSREDQGSFTGSFFGGTLGLRTPVGFYNSLRVWLNGERSWNVSSETADHDGNGSLALIGARLQRDTRGRPGKWSVFSSVQAELAGPDADWSYQFYRVLGDLRGYYSFSRRFMRLSSAVLLGYVAPYGTTAFIPPQELFWAGFNQIRLVRGFDPSDISPLTMSGEVAGGRIALVMTPVEFTFPLVWWTSGALFVDGGQVWQKGEDVAVSDIDWALGVGIRLHLPMGLLRLDYGMELDRDPGFGGRAHLGVGLPF